MQDTAAIAAATKLTFVVVYDSYESADRARSAAKILGRALDGADISESIWRSDLLAISLLREEALQEARRADFVVVALSAYTIPDVVETWLAECRPPHAIAPAIVVLLGENRDWSLEVDSEGMCYATANAPLTLLK